MNVLKFMLTVFCSMVATLVLAGCEDKAKSTSTTTAAAVDASVSPPVANASASAPPPAPVNPDEALAIDEVRDYHRYHHGGLVRFISMAIDTLGVPPDREPAVRKIQGELDTRMMPVHEAERKLLGQLADGVAAGKVDATRADASVADIARLAGTVRASTGDLLKQLHDLLTPAERAALVDKVEAHWEVWRDANVEESPTAAARHEAHLAKLTATLDLTPDQVEKIKEGLAAQAQKQGNSEPKLTSEVDARLKAFAASFNGETFDPKVLAPSDATDSHLVSAGVLRMIHLCEVATPVLTANQRAKFAAHLREYRENEKGAAQ